MNTQSLRLEIMEYRGLYAIVLSPANPKQGNAFSMYVAGGTYSELKTVFDKLSEGADRDNRTFIELDNMPFAYGQLTHEYGVCWILVGQKKNKELFNNLISKQKLLRLCIPMSFEI